MTSNTYSARFLSRSDVADTTIIVVQAPTGIYTVVADADGWDRIVDPSGVIHDGDDGQYLPDHVSDMLTWYCENV